MKVMTLPATITGRVCFWTFSRPNYVWEGKRQSCNLMNVAAIYSAGTAKSVIVHFLDCLFNDFIVSMSWYSNVYPHSRSLKGWMWAIFVDIYRSMHPWIIKHPPYRLHFMRMMASNSLDRYSPCPIRSNFRNYLEVLRARMYFLINSTI